MKCLICGELVFGHLTTPETFAVQTNVPVAEVVVYKCIYGTCGFSGFIIIKSLFHIFYKCVEKRENPAVDFRAVCHRNLRFCTGKSVDICVKSQE